MALSLTTLTGYQGQMNEGLVKIERKKEFDERIISITKYLIK